MEKLIILDTETTGIEVNEGHRIIEIGCVEVINRKITNLKYHQYIQPDRGVGDSLKIHEISDKFLIGKPRFTEIADDFIDFIRNETLVIHNAGFDVGFLDHELKLAGKKIKISNICKIIDSLEVSKSKRAGGRHDLDSICRRYNIDVSKRVRHGALLDAQILAEAYLALTGGQFSFFDNIQNKEGINIEIEKTNTKRESLRVIYANAEELKQHNKYFDIK